MKKIKFFAIGVTLLSITAGALFGIPVYATNLDQLRERRQEIQGERIELEEDLNVITEAISATHQQIFQIEDALRLVEDELGVIQFTLVSTRELLETTYEELKLAGIRRDEQRERLVTRARAMQVNGPARYIDIILSAGSFGDLLLRIDYIGRMINHDQNMAAELRDTEENIETMIETIYIEEQRLLTLEMQELVKIEEYESIQADLYAALAGLEVEERELLSGIRQIEQANREVERLINAAENAALAIATRPSTNRIIVDTTNLDGAKLWPVPGFGNISSGFGNRVWPNGRSEFHTGIDISGRGISGANVIASADGVVIFAGWMNGYGHTVIIEHSDGITTLYAHHSRNLVSRGEIVVAGQVIALVGSTGFSTGPHLHFEVRVNGQHRNPMGFLN